VWTLVVVVFGGTNPLMMVLILIPATITGMISGIIWGIGIYYACHTRNIWPKLIVGILSLLSCLTEAVAKPFFAVKHST
jgi:hypothetical protein